MASEKGETTALLKDSESSKIAAKRSLRRRCCCITLLLVLIAIVATFAVLTPLVFLKKDASSAPSNSREFANAAVAADSGHCSEAGAEMLRKNGSAMDAAIAAMLCIGVVNAQSAGLGGGTFILVYTAATRQSEVIDGRERAPALADRDMFVDDPSKALKG